MPDTLEVFDRWRSSTPSLSSPVIFEMCKDEPTSRATRRRMKQERLNTAKILNSAATSTGAWQGGDYQALLEGDGIISCDSSIDAWSEDGHRNHIESRKKERDQQDSRRRKRASSIVNGTLIMRNTEQLNCPFSQISNTANSEFFSVTLASPLHKFPSTPARSNAGRLVIIPSPTTPRPFKASNLSTARHQSLLTRQISQNRVDGSPLDTASAADSGWMVESQDYKPERASVLLDNLLNGVQKGFVDSPDEMSEGITSVDGWETDDCEITPRLRPVRQPIDDSSESSINKDEELTDTSTGQDSTSNDVSSASIVNDCRRSFIRVPSAIFPHTPGLAQRRSMAGKRLSTMSTSSASFRSSKQYQRSHLSIVSSSLTESESKSISSKRSSVHLASAPRLAVRKSKYYSRPPQPGTMAHLKKQHLKGARGKFWSPMNSLYLEKEQDDDDDNLLAQIRARQSTRYSRRSGQAWVRPRTFEVKDQYRVTVVYPPQVEDSRENDPEKTPTQAKFINKPVESISSTISTKGSSVRGTPPPCPAPTRTLPPLPLLQSVPSSKARNRISRDRRSLMRMSQITTTTTTTTCSQCQQSTSSSSCSCSSTNTVRSSYMTSTSQSLSDSQSCSCADSSTCSCTMTRSSMVSTSTPRQSFNRAEGNLNKASQVLGIPQSAPLYPCPQEEKASCYLPPYSASYYTSIHPPVLDPIPRFSPFCINFDHIFGKRKNKRWTRSSIGTRSSTMADSNSQGCASNQCSTCTGYLTSSSRCSTCEDASELTYLCDDMSQSTSYYTGTTNSRSSLSYSSSSSSSSSSPMSEMDSDRGSEHDSEPPLTPPRSEYQSTYGLSESPGYRMSFIVSPMPHSAKRYSQIQELLSSSPTLEQEEKKRQSSMVSSARPYSQFTTSSSSNMTTSIHGTSRVPRSILKTSTRYGEFDNQVDKLRRPTVSMAENTIFKSSSESVFSSSSSSKSSTSSGSVAAPPPPPLKRSTLATSTLTKRDLEGRIQKEEHRRRRNESRLYALEKLEGKTKKSSLFFSLMSNASTASTGNRSIQSWDLEEEGEEELASPLTPAKQDLLELQKQLENRQRITQFQNNKAVNFTDVIGFDMSTYTKIPSRKRSSSSANSSEDLQKDAVLKHQLRTLSTAIEARQHAKEKFIDK